MGYKNGRQLGWLFQMKLFRKDVYSFQNQNQNRYLKKNRSVGERRQSVCPASSESMRRN